jgi:hypothetical protein
VSLSNDSVLNALKTKFVCGFKNIKGETYAGKSGRHDTDGPAVVTTNGAGPHNVQLFFLSSDGTVLHVLPGYWAPQDLLVELRLVYSLNNLWQTKGMTEDEKKRRFTQAQLRFLRQLPADLLARSHLQGFDAKHELAKEDSDFRYHTGDYHPTVPPKMGGKHHNLKSTVQVVHERMAQRPFVPYEDFDVEKFSDYGKWRYDKKEEMRAQANKPAMKKK